MITASTGTSTEQTVGGDGKGAPGAGRRVYKWQEIRRIKILWGKTTSISSFSQVDCKERMRHTKALED